MVQKGTRAVIGVVIVGMLMGLGLGVVSPSEGASRPPCPFSGGAATMAWTGDALPRPLNPCPGGEWAKTYNGTLDEHGTSIVPTADGGYVVLGETMSWGAGEDLWVLKLNATGAVEWERAYGGPGRERAEKILAMADGTYVVLGITGSFGPNPMNSWLVKLDSAGDILWQQVYSGAKTDYLFDIETTPDGGFIAAGASDSHRTGSGYFYETSDAWVVKLDASGNVVWQKAYGASSTGECASGIRPTPDGGYIVAGTKAQSSGGIPIDLWVFKLSSSGSVVWQKIYGYGYGGQLCGEFMANNPDVLLTPDGGYFVTAVTFYGQYYATDGWIYRLDSAGNVVWRRGWGTAAEDWFVAADTTSDGGYVMVGVGRELGRNAIWVVRIDSASNLVWTKLYSIPSGSAVYGNSAIRQTPDGGFVVTGGWSGGLVVMKINGNGYPGTCVDPGIGADSAAVLTESRRGPLGNNNGKATAPATGASTTAGTFTVTDALVGQQCTS